MVQLFKKKNESTRLLEFNKKKLMEEINNLSDKLHNFRGETSLKIVKEVIEMARNIQILEVNHYMDEKSISIHKGRLQALSDLSAYIDSAIQERPDPSKPRGSWNVQRRKKIQEDMIL